jgi:hypothetical protein
MEVKKLRRSQLMLTSMHGGFKQLLKFIRGEHAILSLFYNGGTRYRDFRVNLALLLFTIGVVALVAEINALASTCNEKIYKMSNTPAYHFGDDDDDDDDEGSNRCSLYPHAADFRTDVMNKTDPYTGYGVCGTFGANGEAGIDCCCCNYGDCRVWDPMMGSDDDGPAGMVEGFPRFETM